MPLIKQIFVVFFICLLGNFLSECIPLPIPNSIMAMVLMLVLLALRWLRADSIRQVVDFLQKNMVFFSFRPACRCWSTMSSCGTIWQPSW